MPKSWFKISLLNFLFAASLGALLRYAFIEELDWMEFRNVMQGHSHVAMLGWVYMSIYGLLVSTILQPNEKRKTFYTRLFWLNQLAVMGMLVAFPLYGYQPISIAFSFLHIICAYFFVVGFWRDFSHNRNSMGALFIKTALVFMVLSTLAIWGLIPVIIAGLKGSAMYYALIQFFLHFQFNGWFIFSLLGVLFWLLEQGDKSNVRYLRPFYFYLSVATIFTYVLAVTWSTPLPVLFFTNSLGVLVQLIALYYFLAWFRNNNKTLRAYFEGPFAFLFVVAVASFILKVLAQSILVVPSIAEIAYTIRNFVIGFLHLILLGMVTSFILIFARRFNLLPVNYLSRTGLLLLVIGIVGSEFVLFMQGALLWLSLGFLPFYYEILFGVSVFIPGGIFLILISYCKSHLAL